MTWFKVDDSFYDHPKVFDAPDCAVALWTRAGCWSARNLTNGFVPSNLPARLCDDPDTAIKELVRRGLWKRVSGGYQFHDWTTYQPTADEVRDLRAKRSAAGRKGGQAKAANSKQTPSKSQASASDVGKQNAAPSRPVPVVPTGPYVAPGRNAHEPEPPPSDQPPTRVEELITWYRDNSPRGLPARQAERLAAEIHQLIADGFTDDEIRQGLAQLRSRKVGPTFLAAAADDFANQPPSTPGNVLALPARPAQTRPSTTDQRVNQALALAARFDAMEEPQ